MKVKCQRCTQEFQMYMDTHGVMGEWGKMAGLCPKCSQMVTAMVRPDDNFLTYPEGVVGDVVTPIPYHEGVADENI